MNITINSKHRMFDLCLHLGCSLKNACSSFKIDSQYSKTELDHKDVQNMYDNDWDLFISNLTNNEQFMKYVYNDVISLKLIYDKYNENISECIYKLNQTVFTDNKNKVSYDEICNIMTGGALAYKLTESGFKQNKITF